MYALVCDTLFLDLLSFSSVVHRVVIRVRGSEQSAECTVGHNHAPSINETRTTKRNEGKAHSNRSFKHES